MNIYIYIYSVHVCFSSPTLYAKTISGLRDHECERPRRNVRGFGRRGEREQYIYSINKQNYYIKF